MIRLEEITKTYGRAAVIRDVSLEVAGGTTVVLVGPSGCGKSTLLRIIAGIVRPNAGRVFVGDQRLSTETCPAIRNRLGYMIQDGGLFPHLTARQNVTLAAPFRGWTEDRICARVAELAERTRFPADALDRYPAQLSGGQRQRVGLMRALMTDPDVLLLDEPLGALDPMIRFDLQDDLRSVFRLLGKTVVLVTHDLHEADFFADEIVLMRAGRIEQRGSAAALVAAPASSFVSRFVRAQRVADFGTTS